MLLSPLIFWVLFFEVKNKNSKDSITTQSNTFHREKDTAKQTQEETLTMLLTSEWYCCWSNRWQENPCHWLCQCTFLFLWEGLLCFKCYTSFTLFFIIFLQVRDVVHRCSIIRQRGKAFSNNTWSWVKNGAKVGSSKLLPMKKGLRSWCDKREEIQKAITYYCIKLQECIIKPSAAGWCLHCGQCRPVKKQPNTSLEPTKYYCFLLLQSHLAIHTMI